MAFRFSKLSPAMTIPASEQMLAHLPQTEDTLISSLMTHIKSEKKVVEQALGKSRTGELTQELSDTDALFDESFQIFVDATELVARRKSRVAPSTSAELVLETIEKQGKGIYRLGRQEQIGRTDALITECQTTQLQSALKMANLTPDYEDMKKHHLALKELMEQSSQVEALKSQTVAPHKAGKALSKSLSDLYRVVKVFARIGNEEYQTTLGKMDETLDKFRSGVK